GTAEELAADPQVRKVYLGQNFELRKTNILEDEPEFDEYGDRIVTGDKKIDYVKNMINVCSKTYNHMGGLRISGVAMSETKELIKKVDEFKTFFATEEVGHRSGQIIKEINFGPERAYFLRLHESMIFFILFWLIPIIGWTFLLILFNSLIRCK